MEMSSDQLAASDAVEHLRENVRLNLQITRNERRHQKVDSIRIGIGEFSKTFADVQTFSEDDVLALANRIKQQKHAKSDNLIQLSHAFLQSSENIQCFLKVTGALNVLVKELTGHDTNTQMLAAEVMCNLSLGSEVSSEKVALCAASYLITFLKSPNEWLVVSTYEYAIAELFITMMYSSFSVDIALDTNKFIGSWGETMERVNVSGNYQMSHQRVLPFHYNRNSKRCMQRH